MRTRQILMAVLAVAGLVVGAKQARAACADPISCCIAAGNDPISCVCPVQNQCQATQFQVDIGGGTTVPALGNFLSLEFKNGNASLYTDDGVVVISKTSTGLIALATANLNSAD